jgi:hypothetical protein
LIGNLDMLRDSDTGKGDCAVVAHQHQAITRRRTNPAGSLRQLERVLEGNRHEKVPIRRPAVARRDGLDVVAYMWDVGGLGASVELRIEARNA